MTSGLELSEKHSESGQRGGRRTRHCMLSRLQVAVFVTVAILLMAVVGILMAMFGPGSKNLKYRDDEDCKATAEKEKKQTAGSLDVHCRVAIIGGGLSGLYFADTLLRTKKEKNVCLFEKENRFGGRIFDHWFSQALNITVGLGAWRVDGNAVNMMNLIRRLNISTISWDFHKKSTLESRGVFALNNFAKIKQEAFPTLNRGRFKNMTSNDMVSYAFSEDRVSTAPLFTTVDSYMSYYLSPEAAEFLSELYGYKGDYKESINPAAYIEYQKMLFGPDGLSFENFRPLKGMSAVVNSLVASVRRNGGKLYSENAVLSVDKVETSFVLKTASLTILADKLVIATHPVAYLKVKGAVSEEIHREPVFQSIKIMPAFKGAAAYREAWWQNTTGNLTRLNTRQRFVSNSDCLGTSMPYGGTGPNGEAVLHTMYMDGPCSRRWGDILRTSKSHVDRELKRALEYKFGRQVPDPLDTVYQYWDEGAWHFQKPGFNYILTEVSDWAKRPFPGKEIFIVGDAYNPYRGWTEGAILSADNALLEGWNIPKKSISRRKRTKSVPLSELVLDPSTEFQIH